jgi:triosephosphate isomerase
VKRRPFVAGNWKMHLGPTAGADLAAAIRAGVDPSVDATVAVFPTALSIPAVLDALRQSPVAVGVQDVEVAASGAWTGANSAALAREVGCEFALVGHSERRQHYGDIAERVGARLVATLDAGLLPILCVGETLDERRAGRTLDVVLGQLGAALLALPVDRLSGVSIAYEPVWAIGTGETATPDQAQEVHAAIRAWLAASTAPWVAEDCRLLYGGSVKPGNAADLLAQPDIDGALVGGASLVATDFLAILAAALAQHVS